MAKYTVLPHNPEMKGMIEFRPNIVFAQPDGEELALQLVKPMWQPEGEGFPLVVFIQGSAWTKPNQFRQIPQLSQLAQRGYVIASVTHRSALTAKAPAFLEDVKSAIRFLRANAAEYGIDKKRVCAWGTSSGGNTAMLLGLTGDDPEYVNDICPGESSAVQLVVECFGPTDLNRMMEVQYRDVVSMEQKSLFLGLAVGPEYFGRNYSPEEFIALCAEPLKRISPIQYVKPGISIPPFLMLHGDADPVVLYSDTEVMYNKLIECGHDAELVRVTDAPHEGSFWSQELLKLVFDYIDEKL